MFHQPLPSPLLPPHDKKQRLSAYISIIYYCLKKENMVQWTRICGAEGFLMENVEDIIESINFSMKMEDMPLTEEDKSRLRICLNGNKDVNEVLQETIKKHNMVAV
jgi:hypothetical protein